MTAAGLSALRFERSELALAQVNRVLGRFRADTTDRVALAARGWSRISGRTTRTADQVHRIEDALTRFMAIADEYTFGLLVDLTEARLGTDSVTEVLWEFYIERETDSWKRRFGSWKALHGVSIPSFPRYDRLLGYIEARNAIAHGLGSLTRKQQKSKDKTIAHLRAARIGLTDLRLALVEDHALECAALIRAFIEWLDHEAGRSAGNA